MPTKYKVLKDSNLQPKATAGTFVYSLAGYDYGLAADDSRITGIPHTSVTLDPDGAYPSFTIKTADLEKIA